MLLDIKLVYAEGDANTWTTAGYNDSKMVPNKTFVVATRHDEKDKVRKRKFSLYHFSKQILFHNFRSQLRISGEKLQIVIMWDFCLREKYCSNPKFCRRVNCT